MIEDAHADVRPKLKLFNGRAHGKWLRGHHAYIAAHSKTDAARLMTEVFQFRSESSALRELNVYWHAGHWGTNMQGVTPERGVWVINEREIPRTPQRIYPADATGTRQQ